MNLARKAAKASPAQKKALMKKAYMKWKRKGEEAEEDVEEDEDRFNFAKAIAKARKAAAKASPAQKKAFMNLARKAAKASPAQKKALMRKAYMKWKRKGEEAEEDVEEDEDLAWRAFAK